MMWVSVSERFLWSVSCCVSWSKSSLEVIVLGKRREWRSGFGGVLAREVKVVGAQCIWEVVEEEEEGAWFTGVYIEFVSKNGDLEAPFRLFQLVLWLHLQSKLAGYWLFRMGDLVSAEQMSMGNPGSLLHVRKISAKTIVKHNQICNLRSP